MIAIYDSATRPLDAADEDMHPSKESIYDMRSTFEQSLRCSLERLKDLRECTISAQQSLSTGAT